MTAVAEMADAIEASFGIELGSIGRVDVSPNMYEYQKDGGRWHSMNTGRTEVPGRDLQWVSTVSKSTIHLITSATHPIRAGRARHRRRRALPEGRRRPARPDGRRGHQKLRAVDGRG